MNALLALLFVFSAVNVIFVHGYMSIKRVTQPRVKPVNENFFLDIAEDPAKNTPQQIFGEVTYKNFVGQYEPDALILGNYDIIARVRELKLLTATADAGLLEALEEKGLTLSQVEKLLPVIDSLGLLPLLVQNKDLVLSAAPLLIEPAPALLPILVSIIKTPASSFTVPGGVLVALGAYESLDNVVLGVLVALLGAPLLILGSILSGSISLPTPSKPEETFAEPVIEVSSRPKAAAAKSVPTVTVSTSVTSSGANLNGKRKTVRIK
jgi:hypothetical protein